MTQDIIQVTYQTRLKEYRVSLYSLLMVENMVVGVRMHILENTFFKDGSLKSQTNYLRDVRITKENKQDVMQAVMKLINMGLNIHKQQLADSGGKLLTEFEIETGKVVKEGDKTAVRSLKELINKINTL